jgi:hypothetical protein
MPKIKGRKAAADGCDHSLHFLFQTITLSLTVSHGVFDKHSEKILTAAEM